MPKDKILILSAYSENRVVDDYGRNDWAEVTTEVNRKYAERHGYSFKCIKYRDDDLLDGFWATWLKIDVILKHLSSYDYICWIDADAIFFTEEPLDFLFGKDISIMKETPSEGFAQTLTMTTTGFMLFKNTAFSKMVLESLLKQSGEWDNGNFKKNRWHEQGLMDEMFVIPQVIQTYRFDSSYYKLVNRSVEDISAYFETDNFLIFPSKLQTADVDDVHFVFHAKGGSVNKKDRIEKVLDISTATFNIKQKTNKVNFNIEFNIEENFPKIFIKLADDVDKIETKIYYKELGTGLTLYHDLFTFENKITSFFAWIYVIIDHIDGVRVDIVDVSSGELIYSEDKKYREITRDKIYSDLDDMAFNQYREVFLLEDYKYFCQSEKGKIIQVEDGDICVDIGANLGFFSMYAIQQGAEKVYAVEPCAKTFKFLTKNVDGKNVEVINKALGNKNGDRSFCINNTLSGGNHLDGISHDSKGLEVQRITVSGMNINDFLHEYSIDYIDFLKIDCEGSEYEIFEAIDVDYLKNNIGKIVGEFHDSRNGEIYGVVDKLKDCGFECEFYSPTWGGTNPTGEIRDIGIFVAWKNNKILKKRYETSNK